MKISRTKITASSVDKRLSFTSTKYKGYRISLDHKNNCYNIYDKHGELEDSGFTSQLAAKDAVDKLVEASEVKSSKKITASMMYEDMDGSIAGEVGEYISLEDLVDMYDDLKDYDPIVEQYDSFESWLRDTINNGYLREVYSSNKITAVEASSAIEGSLLEYRCMDNEVADKGSVISHRDLFKLWKKRNSLPKNDPEYVPYNTVNAWLSDLIQQGSLVESSICVNCGEDIEYLDNQDILREFIDELVENGVDIYDDQDILQELGANYGYDKDDQFAILEDIREYVGQGINSAEETDDELETTEQEFTSRDTSINSSKLPAIYKLVKFPKGAVVLDFGGGKFDNAVEYLDSIGCEGYVYDPYNRTAEHNAEVVKAIRANGGADIVLNSNVLNVIKEPAARRTVLKNIKKLVKPSGKIYITVYEGNGSGEGKQSKKDSFQLNRKTADYLEEIQEVFPDATRKGKLIVATPNGAPVKSSIQASEDIVTVGIYGDQVDGFEIVDQIVNYFKSKGIKVSDVSGDLDYGWEMNLTGEPRQLFLAVCNKIPGYNSNSVDEFIDEYRIDDSINGCDYINSSEDIEIDYDKLEEIANRYNTSKPISGDWYKETEHELRAIASELGLSMKQAKQVMIEELGFEEEQFADIPINSSEDSLTSRIFDFLDDCGGYTDYNQKVEDVSEEFGMSPDEAEGYVSSWAQGMDAMWHDTADQYEDEDIEESCKVEASISPSRAKEIVGTLERRLKKKVSQVMQSEEFGFPADEVANYSAVEVEYQPEANRIKCEVRAEVDFGGLMELAEELNPIVEKYNEWAYFDAVTSGIIESYIPLNDVYSSTSTNKKAVTASYSEPEDLVREYEIVFDTTATVTEDSFEVDATDELNEIYDDEYNIIVEDDSNSILENLQDLIEVNMPDEPGKYRISGIAHMKYFIDNLYRAYEGPSDPDDALGSSWFNSEAADITYDARSSYVEAFQVEKV